MPVGRWYQEDGGSGYDDSSAPPPAAEEETESGPIGIPDDYPIPGGAPGPLGIPDSSYQVTYGHPGPKSRYMEGDEWIPANYPADMLYTLQQQLVAAGLLTDNFTAGVYDPATRNAYKNLLGLANAQGADANQTLSQMVQSAASLPQQGPDPLITQTTDPTVARNVFRKAAIELTGEGWSREQINSMVGAYNQLERQRQQEAYDLQLEGQAGNVVSVPSLQDYAESQIMEQDPEGVQTEQGLDYLSDFLGMATGGQWRGF